MAFVEFKDVRKIYTMGEVQVAAVDGMSFEIEQGELVVVVGPSGSGKTTLLNMIDSGEPTFGPCAMKNLHVRQNSFTTTSRSTSGFSSISSPHAVSWVGRSHTANLQSPGQRSPGILCGQRLAISSSQPRVSQQCNAISAPFFTISGPCRRISCRLFSQIAQSDTPARH